MTKDEAKRIAEQKKEKLYKRFSKVINPKSPTFKEMKKSEFKEQFKGKLPFDLNQAWDFIIDKRK